MLFDEDEINGTTAKDERGKPVNFQPEELHYFCYDWVRFCVRPLTNCLGKFEDRLINKDSIARDEDEKSHDPELEKYARITIDPKYVSDDNVLLHEMIHLHETALEDFPTSYHDTLLWQLYQKLFREIPDLSERITAFTCLPIQETITTYGGCHDILFLLKSYDLDIRMGYPLGKVLGYRVPGFPVKQ